MSVSGPYRTSEVQVLPTEILKTAVEELSQRSGHKFLISEELVPGTSLFVVHTHNHPFRPDYTVPSSVLGFRVPSNFPDAAPEDSFFIAPTTIKLQVADPVRKSIDIPRAGAVVGHVVGSVLGQTSVLVFSWHLWDRRQWNRRTNTLIDHYTHSIRRFEQPEHD